MSTLKPAKPNVTLVNFTQRPPPVADPQAAARRTLLTDIMTDALAKIDANQMHGACLIWVNNAPEDGERDYGYRTVGFNSVFEMVGLLEQVKADQLAPDDGEDD